MYTCKQFISVLVFTLLCLFLFCFVFIRQYYSLSVSNNNNIDRDVMVNFEPGEYMRMMIFLSVTQLI